MNIHMLLTLLIRCLGHTKIENHGFCYSAKNNSLIEYHSFELQCLSFNILLYYLLCISIAFLKCHLYFRVYYELMQTA